MKANFQKFVDAIKGLKPKPKFECVAHVLKSRPTFHLSVGNMGFWPAKFTCMKVDRILIEGTID